MPKSKNIDPKLSRINMKRRWKKNQHSSGVLWFTGLSGSGKSTLATELEALLFKNSKQVYVLDGDNLRFGLNSDLGFLPADRKENIRRIGEIAALFAEAGFIVITAFISPYRIDRDNARSASSGGFHEIYLSANLNTCIERDPKGLYAKAQRGEISDFTGISAPYEPPEKPELTIDTGILSEKKCIEILEEYVRREFSR